MDSLSVQDWIGFLDNRDAGKFKHINKPEGWLVNHSDWLLLYTHRWSQGALGSHASCDPWDSGGSRNALIERQENEAKVRTPTFSSNTASFQEGARDTHTELPSPSATRLQGPLLTPGPSCQRSGKDIFSVVSKLPTSCSSFKFKPYLCPTKTKSMQVILWGSGSEIKGSRHIVVLFLKDILGRGL